MSPNQLSFTIRATASRLEKGFIAIPQKFGSWFPKERSRITLAFDDEQATSEVTFHPHDPSGKENRVFGTKEWFSKRQIVPGDLITIRVENPAKRVYRIILDRFLREKEQRESRQRLESAATESEAQRELSTLVRLARKRSRRVAREELLRLAQNRAPEKRLRVASNVSGRHETAPAAIRVLLRELHDGKCQLCSFSFQKRNGQPYFEIHHLEPAVGHHPANLLVICANCHAQLEHAMVTDLVRNGIWLTSLRINGRRIAVRQPLLGQATKAKLLALIVAAMLSTIGRVIAR